MKLIDRAATASDSNIKNSSESGISVVEILLVLVVLSVLLAFAIPLSGFRGVYKTEDQALKIMDLMREASKLAMSRRSTFRVEIDQTANTAMIIDERGNVAGLAVKTVPLNTISEVKMDQRPTGITVFPTAPALTDAVYATDAAGGGATDPQAIGHKNLSGGATVSGNTVWKARFRSDGSVVDKNGVPINVNLYLYPPVTSASTTAGNPKLVRAVTVTGGNGAVRYYRYDGTAFAAQ